MESKQDKIKFTYNWNNKLFCKAFTTIRVYDPIKYRVGNAYDIYLDRKRINRGKILEIKTINIIDNINEFTARVDTGYSKAEFLKIIYQMYPNAKNLIFCIILLENQENGQGKLFG